MSRLGPAQSLEMVRAWIQLSASLPLFEKLVGYDGEAREAIKGKDLVVQFEVKDGPVAHLCLADGEITYGLGTHSRPDIRLTFSTPDRLNRMFAGENVRPRMRKGLRHLRFLLGDFQVLSDRLSHYMEGEGSTPSSDGENQRFLVEMRLQAMLAGTAAIANHDPWMEDIAEAAPAGSMCFRVLPDGPKGSLTKRGDRGWVGGVDGSVDQPSSLIEFSSLDGAKRLVYQEASLEGMAGLGEARMVGNILLSENVNELITRFVSVIDV